ncbi:hypothetical protein [Nocardioides pacificus]
MHAYDELPLALPDSHPRLPLARPFTLAQARDVGVSRDELTTLCAHGILRRPLLGVYVDNAVPDTTLTRVQALSLVLPEDAVVTEETACWVYGLDLDPPGARWVAAPLRVFRTPGSTRIRKLGCDGGERTLRPEDVAEVAGIRVLSPVRLALDMARLRPRDQALAALDQIRRHLGVGLDELIERLPDFKGARGIVQGRELVPLSDPRAESQAESFVRIRCRDAGLILEPQLEVRRHDGWLERAYLDLGDGIRRFAVEYDGRAWHESDEQRARDRRRRAWVREEHGFGICVLTDRDVYGVPREQTAHVVRKALEQHLRGP